MKFIITLEEDEDGFIVASCPALTGCHSQGRTREEAIANIKEAIRGYIASMGNRGEPIPSVTEVREMMIEVPEPAGQLTQELRDKMDALRMRITVDHPVQTDSVEIIRKERAKRTRQLMGASSGARKKQQR